MRGPYREILTPCIMCVQYIGGCSVHRGCPVHRGDIMSTLGDIQYIGDIMMNVGDTMSTSGDLQYIGGCLVHRRDTISTSEGYHQYIGGIS